MRLSILAAPALCAFLCFPAAAQKISDMGAAEAWCDATMLDRVEGIWEFPDDNTSVLIRHSDFEPHRYDIIVVETPDTRIAPGDKIGYLAASASPDKFEMGLYRTKAEKGILSELGKCLAHLSEKDDAIYVKGRNVKLSLASRWLLPSFWRMIKVTVKDPLESLPRGMIRIYPNSSRKRPDYL